VYIGEPCTIEGNQNRGNRTVTDGGGIYMGGNKTLVRRNTILENIAGDHGGGIYIVNDNLGGGSPREVEVAENLIIENTSLGLDNNIDCSGGGIRVSGGAWVHHNTIIFNHAESIRFPAGGGICLTDTRSGTLIENNLIYGCNEGGVVAAKRLAEPYEAVVRRNLLFGNGQMEIYNEDPEWWRLQLEENVFENPLLCIDGLGSEGTVAENSPALTQPWGVIGATAEPGCGPVGIVRER